jgi:predicted metalloprotease
LQADCLSGIWLQNATATGYITNFTSEQIAQALNAAASVGADRIQKQTQGYVVPDAWSTAHPSSAWLPCRIACNRVMWKSAIGRGESNNQFY